MSFPTSTISTDNLDSSADDPSLARVDLLDAVTKLNTIISEADTAYGVPVLNSSGLIKSTQLPTTISAAGTQILSPSTGIVNIQSILRISPQSQATIVALTGVQEGDMVLCANITAGNVNVGGIAFYTGSAWKAIPWTANVFVSLT